MDRTKIIKCTCRNKYQDKKYGTYLRAHNYGEKCNGGNPGYRCTVCGTIKGR